MTTNQVAHRHSAETARETVELKRRALQMGFDAVGVAALEPNAHAAELDRWLAAGYAGTMTYLHRQSAKRKQPARIMPGAKVAVVTLTNYFHDPGPPARGQPRVAAAWRPAPRPRSSSRACWTRRAASPTSPSSTTATSRLTSNRWSATGCSAATCARTSARGT